MGTYTTNYNLFMPSIGEQGWGTLVNGNFSTIDTTMKGLNTRIGTLETEADNIEERVAALEPLSIIQVDSNKNVTFPGSVTAGNYTGVPTKYNYIVTPTGSTFTIYPSLGISLPLMCVPFGSTISGTVSATTAGGDWVSNGAANFVFFKNDGTISTVASGTNVSIPANTYMVIFNLAASASNYWTSGKIYGLKLVSITAIG